MSTLGSSIMFLSELEAAMAVLHECDSPIVVGVSGGADSTALLLGLVELRSKDCHSAEIIIAHGEHDLRSEASGDREFVVSMAKRLELKCICQKINILDQKGSHGLGIEGRARELRYKFFENVAYQTGSRCVAVAHTADDQAETILHRILRGTGIAGVAGMSAARELCEGISIIRPLLHMRKEVIHEWLLSIGQSWREDESNTDIRFSRNFLRHEIIKSCEEGAYPSATEAIVRLGSHAAGVSAALASAADVILENHVTRADDGKIRIRLEPLRGLDPFLVHEVFAQLWRKENWPRRDMTMQHYKKLVGLIKDSSKKNTSFDLPSGIRAEYIASARPEITIRLQKAPACRQ
ncbi:MAG: tRNA lysidine(34) synthetase TilS [Pirellulales bacterium]